MADAEGRGRKGRRTAGVLLAAGIFAAMLAGAGALVFQSAGMESGQARTMLEYRAFTLATVLFEEFGSDGAVDLAQYGDVLGFAIYGPGGELRYGAGNAPDSFTPSPGALGARFDEAKGELSILRQIGPQRGMMMGAGKGARQGPGMMGAFAFAFVRIGAGGYYSSVGALRTRSILILAAFAAVLAAAFILWRRNLALAGREARARRLASLGEAARLILHETRNPLGVMRIQCATLRSRGGESISRNVEAIEAEISKLNGMSERIAQYLREDEGRPERIDLAALLGALPEKYQGRVAVSCPPGLVARFDRGRLESILDNLIANALESMGEGGVAELTASRRAGRVRVEVADRGAAPGPEEESKLFEPFFTTKPAGSGIGLSVARRFMELGGGTIEFARRKGGGSLFSLVFEGGAE